MVHGAGKAGRLREMLHGAVVTEIAGVNDGFSAVIAAAAGFPALWASGLGISAARGVPDVGILGAHELLDAAGVINRTPLPVIADCGDGAGDVNVTRHLVSALESAGIAAACIEDAATPKRNSLLGAQLLADAEEFAARIQLAKRTQRLGDFTLIARLESLIAGTGLQDALRRAHLYVDAGADAVLIHSRAADPEEVLAFASRWAVEASAPLMLIPTTYPSVQRSTLQEHRVAGVVFANQAFRAAQRAMQRTFEAIRRSGSALAVEDQISSMEELLETVGMHEVARMDDLYLKVTSELRASRRPAVVGSKRGGAR